MRSAHECPLYIASPFGFSEASRDFYNRVFLPRIASCGFLILDPWQLTSQTEVSEILALPYGEARRDAWSRLNRIIGQTNEDAIRSARGMVAVLDGTDVDSGTAAEIGFGYALQKPVVGYRGDFRLSADNEGGTVNLQVEHFIYGSGGRIVRTLDALEEALSLFLNR